MGRVTLGHFAFVLHFGRIQQGQVRTVERSLYKAYASLRQNIFALAIPAFFVTCGGQKISACKGHRINFLTAIYFPR